MLFRSRKFVLDKEKFTVLESDRKQVQSRTEELQAKRNQLAKTVGMKKGKGEDASAEIAESTLVNNELQSLTERLSVLQLQLNDFLMNIPNIPHESVPSGKDETENQEILRWGKIPQFDYPVKDHVDLAANFGLDFDAAVKVTGSRFAVMQGPIARLHRALEIGRAHV